MHRVIFFFLLTGFTSLALAIDNPDAPDYLREFLKHVNCYEKKLTHYASSTQDYRRIYKNYEVFLNQELNRVYSLLLKKLDITAQQALKQSQQEWLSYRDKEFEFINSHWNRTNFGSSSVISRGSYRTTLIKDRIIALLHYLKNY